MITGLPRVAIAVYDMDHAIRTFRGAFALPVHEFEEVRTSLGIRMALCVPGGGSHIELMAPLDPGRAHSQSLLRFLERRGEGLFALMLHSADPDAEARELGRRGLDVMPPFPDAGGRDIHPKNARGVLIRIYPEATGTAIDRELERALDTGSAGPVSHLRGVTRIRIAVNDLEDALRVYRDQLGLTADVRARDPELGLHVAICTAERGAAIELLAPEGVARTPARDDLDQFLRERGEGLYALILESRDTVATRRALATSGIGLRETPGILDIDARATFGARLRIEIR